MNPKNISIKKQSTYKKNKSKNEKINFLYKYSHKALKSESNKKKTIAQIIISKNMVFNIISIDCYLLYYNKNNII